MEERKCSKGYSKLIFHKKQIVHILLYMFFLYGILYFFNPQSVYDDSSNIKYVRFILVFLLWVPLFRKTKTKNILLYFILSTVLLIDSYIAVWYDTYDLINVLNFILPISCFFLYHQLDKKWLIKLIEKVYIISSIFTYLECFVFHGVYTEHRFINMGYRVVSIFINPNTYGCFLVLMSIIILYDPKVKIQYKIITFGNSLFIAYLTGSRSCMLILMISYLIVFLQRLFLKKGFSQKTCILLFLGLLCASVLLVALSRTELPFSTRAIWSSDLLSNFSLKTNARSEYNIEFMTATKKNILFPWFSKMYYVDNLYLYIWGRFGLFFLIVYLGLLIFLEIKIFMENQKENLCLFICFVIYGIVLNFLYLWPISYVFWYFVADVFHHKKRSQFLR